jgi:DNA repair exonuclease SbcCD ATPase subunit
MGNSGEGKSTIIDAISFGLYGKSYRNIKKGQIINSINKKKLVVEIYFNEYKVVRGISPVIFEIYKNDELVEQTADVRSYQEYLEKEILKMSFKTFIQTVVLGSAAFTPFMQMSPAHRREVIEDVLDIHIFSKMSALAKSRFDYYKKDIADLQYKISVLSESIKTFQDVIDSEKVLSDEEIKSIASKREEKKIEYKNTFEKIKSKKAELTKLSEENSFSFTKNEISEAIRSYYGKIKAIETEISIYNKEKAFLADNNNCSMCKQKISHEHKEVSNKEINQNLESLNSKLEKMNERYSTLQESEKRITSYLNTKSDIETEISISENLLSVVEKSIIELNTRIKELKAKRESSDTNLNEQKLAEFKTKITKHNNELEKLQKLHKTTKNCIDILKDSGIKTVVISKYIPIFNQLINKYLEKMDMFVLFELDSEFNETIKSRFRDSFSYFSFSEGEKKRIDLAILLAFRDITKLKNSTASNTLIIDELMDGLDSTNVDNVEAILNEFHDTNIMIISHNEDIKNRELFSQVITAKKINNFTEYEIN